MKKLILATILATLLIASQAMAASWSSVKGGVAGEAGFIGVGIAGFEGGFGANGGSLSWTGSTQVAVGGEISGLTAGLGYGNVDAGVKAAADAFQCAGFAEANAGVLAGSSAVIEGAGIAISGAGGFGSAGATID